MTRSELLRLRIAFALSGCSALVFQVVWFRKLSLFLGATTEAASVTLAVFMLGLALGSSLARPLLSISQKPAFVLAALELAIGAYGVLSIHVLDLMGTTYAQWIGAHLAAQASRHLLFRSAMAAAGLIVPTTLMGATFPVMLQVIGPKQGNAGSISADFYAANTVGAAAGALITGFFLIAMVGLTGATVVAASLNCTAAALILLQWHQRVGLPVDTPASDRWEPDAGVFPLKRSLLLAAIFFVAGFSTFALETLWTRWLIFIIGGNSASAFGMILFGFLGGIQFGSRRMARDVDKLDDPLWTFGLVLILVGVTALLASSIIGSLPIFLDRTRMDSDGWHALATFITFLCVLGPAALGGATVSLAASAIVRRNHGDFAGRMGRYYAINTIGCVLGALIAGFLLLPLSGLRGGIIIVAMIDVLAGVVTCVTLSSRRFARPFALAAAAGGLAAILYFLPPPIALKLNHTVDTLEYYSESSEASIAVVRNHQTQLLSLLVHGDYQAGSGPGQEVHLRLLGHLPSLFSLHTDESLVIGLGAGFTTGSVLTHPFTRVTQVELSRSIPRASRYFQDLTGRPLDDPRLELIFDDGRNFLLTTDRSFDVITTDPIDPNDAGATSLYAREFYELVKKRLRPGGVAAQWLGLTSDISDYRILVRTFQDVFPNTFLWLAQNTTVAIGFKDRPHVTRSDVEARLKSPRVQESLRRINVHGIDDLVQSVLGSGTSLEQAIGAGPLNTDNFPLIEYSHGGTIDARMFVQTIVVPLAPERDKSIASLLSVAKGGF